MPSVIFDMAKTLIFFQFSRRQSKHIPRRRRTIIWSWSIAPNQSFSCSWATRWLWKGKSVDFCQFAQLIHDFHHFQVSLKLTETDQHTSGGGGQTVFKPCVGFLLRPSLGSAFQPIVAMSSSSTVTSSSDRAGTSARISSGRTSGITSSASGGMTSGYSPDSSSQLLRIIDDDDDDTNEAKDGGPR